MQLVNHLLLAMPHLENSEFSGSVVYMCQHDDEGSMGIILNKLNTKDLYNIIKHIKIPCKLEHLQSKRVLNGGPSHKEMGILLHSPAGNWKNSTVITNEIAITVSKDILIAVSKGEGPENFKMALGYCSWKPKQLAEEITQNYWIVAPATPELLFNTLPAKLWSSAAKQVGIENKYQIPQYYGNA